MSGPRTRRALRLRARTHLISACSPRRLATVLGPDPRQPMVLQYPGPHRLQHSRTLSGARVELTPPSEPLPPPNCVHPVTFPMFRAHGWVANHTVSSKPRTLSACR